MDVPIVQGVAVKNGDGVPSDSRTPYMSTSDGAVQQFDAPRAFGGQQHEQQGGCKDIIWAVAFVAHLVAIGSLIVLNMGNIDVQFDSEHNGVIILAGISAVISIVLATLSLGFMMRYAALLVKAALVFTVVMSGAAAIMLLMTGSMVAAIVGLGVFGLGICYARAVWHRIPFAAANLNTALTAVKANMGLSAVAYLFTFFGFVWTVLWFVGAGNALSEKSVVILFLLLLSYYWTHQVLQNTVHVTTAGTIGTWWFVPDEASSGCCSPAIMDSFRRATTTSFGSICFGSFILAFIQALRTTREMVRDNDDCNILSCIIDCILGCIESIIEYFNKWAYVYVGLYGFSYLDAGRNVVQLFQEKGWTVVITDDLADNVLMMVSIGIGLLTGLVTMVFAMTHSGFLDSVVGDDGNPLLPAFLIGLIAGFAFSSILMGVVASAVNTVIVCYAESPAEFEQNHPQLSAEMRAAWLGAYPDLTGI